MEENQTDGIWVMAPDTPGWDKIENGNDVRLSKQADRRSQSGVAEAGAGRAVKVRRPIEQSLLTVP